MSNDADPLASLLALNLELAGKEERADKITPPGLPLSQIEAAPFITADRILPATVPAATG